MKISYDCQERWTVFTKWQPDVIAKYPLTSNKGKAKFYRRTGHEFP